MTDVSLLQAEITRLQEKIKALTGAKETAEMHMQGMAEELERLRKPLAVVDIDPKEKEGRTVLGTMVGYQCIRGCGRIAESGLVCEECLNAKPPVNPAGDDRHLRGSLVDDL